MTLPPTRPTGSLTAGTNSVGRLTVNDGELEDLVDPHTGEQVRLRVPPGYENSQMWFVQWLDDTRFTLISVIPGRYGNWPGGSAPVGDLLVCRITEGRCDVRLDSSNWPTAPRPPARPRHQRGRRFRRGAGDANGPRWRMTMRNNKPWSWRCSPCSPPARTTTHQPGPNHSQHLPDRPRHSSLRPRAKCRTG